MTRWSKKRTLELPSFFVVGAQKAGTTSLQHWLAQQPDVCLPWTKETFFFAFDEHYELGIDWYARQFPKRKSGIVGEICPEYMYWMEAPRRMREWVSAPNLVFIFRHPIERAFSHYLMVARSGREPLEFGQALLEEGERLANGGKAGRTYYAYMDRARYAKQVERYQELFPDARFLFVKFEDLTDGGNRGFDTYRTICEFIGVKSSPALADRSERMNPASEPRSIIVQNLLSSESALKQSFRKWVPAPVWGVALKMARWNLRPIARQPMPRVPKKIVDEARIEIRKLEALTGWDLGDWMAKDFSA